MIRKRLVLISLLYFNFTMAFADTCLQQYQGHNFYAAYFNMNANNAIQCSYSPDFSITYVAKYGSKPVSGPWQYIGSNLYNCVANIAGECVFA